jgi:phosphoglycerol transferase MdoB-like AlkP superfamily enzyme
LQQVPSHFRRNIEYRMSEADALGIWRNITGRVTTDARYPLLQHVRGCAGSSVENLVIIQVEGFSQSVLDQQRDGRPVMPFVRKLANEGYYFPNTFQCANFTSGGVFSTLASMPRATYDEPGSRFTSYELNGYYGSPAHIFGTDNYAHFFMFGFRQSCDDFTAFTANQGCRVFNYFDFAKILKRKNQLAEADTLLGIFDGYFFDESAKILLECPTRFTAHLVTTSTHSPWATPASFPKQFDEPEMNTFAYLDASIRKFCEQLQSKPGLWEKTLLVIVGDHTSVTFGNTWLERFRIPLVFYTPDLPPRPNPDPIRASQVDVLHTALALFPGSHLFAGMGRNLLDPSVPHVGLVAGTASEGYFLKDEFVLSYDPQERDARLFGLTGETITADEVTAQHAEANAQLRKEYFATVELARRLAVGKQIFPISAGQSTQDSSSTV